jgi:hypothetical protein
LPGSGLWVRGGVSEGSVSCSWEDGEVMDVGVEVIQVVRTRLEHRGTGSVEEPHRLLEQFWSLDGELLAENDPVEIERSGWPEWRPGRVCPSCETRERRVEEK